MTLKKYPKGFNKVYRLLNDALRAFILSDSFHGIVSPGKFYEYCSNCGEKKFSSIDAYFFNEWDDLNLQQLCFDNNVAFREKKATATEKRSSARTAGDIIGLVKSSPKDSDHKSVVCAAYGKKRTVVSAEINRTIGTENLKYLVSIDFDVNDIPDLQRKDLKNFFTTLRTNGLRSISEYIDYIRIKLNNSVSFDEFPEHKPKPEPGWIYLFPSKSNASVFKCGKSTREKVKSRLDEHVLSGLADESLWSFIYRSNDVEMHEESLKGILSQYGTLVQGTEECFNVINKNIEQVWFEFINQLKT
ncbi:hypothetical protein R7R52_11620 [Vibrio sp. 665]|uniref:hypothetical protein n=1 Tax=Vibrio TaxID=662 RepID=UPI001BD21D88|nr:MULTISPECIES: hypothetical protein [Vibrio]MBS9878220.1 hypothetical protein [Vibrio alginolyticus]MDW2032637.1 hypothetical protein [Vibrio sp. 665]